MMNKGWHYQKGAILAGDLMGTKARLLPMPAMAEVGNNLEKLEEIFQIAFLP
ncbi:MAG: hypothetical protein HN366_17080 [Deltaproteobacteria bacterium]|jgi:L-asparaginase/Glu-tRNA(Gln) amidotransferase subunit D|nr:hypothetical protein [Deltaproteobacteria bacterium]